ncbi:hypothetical protein Bca4012_010480 [Brassica carinata]
MGMWIVVLRSALVGKKYELWFIVNDVPIRYSLRELGLISGLHCHDYPPNHEMFGDTSFNNKYFGGIRVTYACVEEQMLAMKGKPSLDHQKMAVLYFLASIIVGGRKSGDGASLVESFFLRVVEDLDLLAFEAIPSLRNYFREKVFGAYADCQRMCKMQYKRIGGTKAYSLKEMNGKLSEMKDIESILVATPAEEGLLKRIMGKESCLADDEDDAAVDGWTRIIQKGKNKIFLEEPYKINMAARTTQVEAPTILAIEGAAHAESVEDVGVEALKELEGRLMNAIRDVMKEVNIKVESLGNRLTPLEKEVILLKMSVSGGGNDDILSIAQEIQSEHGMGKDEEEDGCAKDAEMDDSGLAEMSESFGMSEKAENDVAKDDAKEKESGDVQTEMKKYKSERKLMEAGEKKEKENKDKKEGKKNVKKY